MRKSSVSAFVTPAVVLGAGVNGLGVVRSLARRRVPVWLVNNSACTPEMRTRYGRKVVVPAVEGPRLVESLVELAQRHFSAQRPVLFLTQEHSVRTVSDARDAIVPYYRLALPNRLILTELMHKNSFYRRAQVAGSPVPLTLHLRSAQDLELVSRMRFPAVLKPGRRDQAYTTRFKKAYRIESAKQAVTLASEILPLLPDLILQEWIEGEDSDIFFCFQYVSADGIAVASFTGRKIRSWPPQVGGTASCVPAPEMHAELDRLTSSFFRATGFIGMGSMEYKRDNSSGRLLMIEPTVGRTDYQEEVATLNGVNLPFAAYCHELGLPIPQNTAVDRMLWRHATIDRWSAKIQGQVRGHRAFEKGRTVDAYWRAYDPAPWLYMQAQNLFRRLKPHVGRFIPTRVHRMPW